MTPPLFLIDTVPNGDTVTLGGDEGRHAARVRRIGVGEVVFVGDGAGTVLECAVSAVRSDGLALDVRARRSVPAPDPRLVVVQALPKGERAEIAVEVLTELGADAIVPWAASRSVTRWDGPRGQKALERWRRTAREAVKQSRRAWAPSVRELASTADVCALLAAAAGLVLHEAATTPLVSVEVPSRGDLVVVVGPEGGIAAEELSAFTAAGALIVRLGDPVLRTSTAGAAALAVLSARLGRWV